MCGARPCLAFKSIPNCRCFFRWLTTYFLVLILFVSLKSVSYKFLESVLCDTLLILTWFFICYWLVSCFKPLCLITSFFIGSLISYSLLFLIWQDLHPTRNPLNLRKRLLQTLYLLMRNRLSAPFWFPENSTLFTDNTSTKRYDNRITS